MYDDIEADYWKEIFVHMQHKNMVRQNAERLAIQDAQKAFERFSFIHPELKCEVTNAGSYITWEVFISDTVKLRLFIQSSIKGTLLQKDGGDLTKIADAKFFNNPFPEIEEFFKNRDFYLRELNAKKDEGVRLKKKQKLAAEFIKAKLKKKYENQTDVMWNLEIRKEDFLLKLTVAGETREIVLTGPDF